MPFFFTFRARRTCLQPQTWCDLLCVEVSRPSHAEAMQRAQWFGAEFNVPPTCDCCAYAWSAPRPFDRLLERPEWREEPLYHWGLHYVVLYLDDSMVDNHAEASP